MNIPRYPRPIEPPIDEEYSNEYNFTTDNDAVPKTVVVAVVAVVDIITKTKDKVLPTPCHCYTNIFVGGRQDPFEVYKLQWFLSTFENLEVPLSGVYDLQTYEAVKIFQARHASDVLHTWGITEPTGYVYITTQLMVNYIYCDIDEPIRLELENPTQPTFGGQKLYGSKLPGKGDGLEYLVYPPSTERGEGFRGLSIDLPDEVDKKVATLFSDAAGFLDWVRVPRRLVGGGWCFYPRNYSWICL